MFISPWEGVILLTWLIIPILIVVTVFYLFLRLLRAAESIAATLRRIEDKLDRRQ